MKKFAGVARAALAAAALFGGTAVWAAQVVVGQVGPMSGLEASQGRAYAAGMQLYFDSVNKAGGVGGNTFKLVRRDDGGRPEDTVSITKAMIAEEKPTVLAGYFGSKNIADLVASGILAQEKIALVGYRTAEIRPETPYLYNVRAGLKDEIDKLTQHLATIGITKLALFYEDGPGAPALLTAADEAAKKAKASIAVKAPYPAGTARVTPAVDAVIKAAPQAVIMVSTGAAAAGFIEQYKAGGGTAQLFTHSGADIEQMAKRLSEEQMQGVAITQVTPSPYKVNTRLTKEFNELVTKAGNLDVPVSYSMIEGYIAAKVIAEAARRQGGKASREGMVAALDSIDNFDMGGYAVGFKPNQRNGSKFVELSIISGAGKIRQ
ncbi:ABC transporter substrate-binding protein [Ramlibacter albus]|uniref:ABC transporter substrate-binding protein n=1 Tax=Ramlibacter albus TaxID=2079448 RepID=A0A923M790_9BURK|nr:ABC transporter substrate-binding protein [Ramlibacter albus]MBC5764188.1 ABC transporter substrate-binding protein [Ramlibacter albus]